MKQPCYPHKKVFSVGALRYPLGMNEEALWKLARCASQMYFVSKEELKADRSGIRVLYDTRQPLKVVLKRINSNFLRKVDYPEYITGGVQGKDYVSSADIHKNAAFVIKEDITKFYPSVTKEAVYNIWRRFFCFSDDVSELLSLLTTRDGHLEQGAPTSSYLANLVLWDIEPTLIERLQEKGFTGYSRHVDDIVISSKSIDAIEHRAWAISQVFGMLSRKGLKCNRGKHKFMPGNKRITILNLTSNKKPSLPKEEKSRVRSVVHEFCKRVDDGNAPADLLRELPKVRGQAYKVKRFHEGKGCQLVAQVAGAAAKLRERKIEGSVTVESLINKDPVQELDRAPWDD